MIHKDGNEWIEKVLFDIVQKVASIIDKVSVLDLRIGTSRGSIIFVETLAFWLNGAIDSDIFIVADPSTCAIEWTKKIWARRAQTWTNQSLWKSTSTHANIQFLKVVFAD